MNEDRDLGIKYLVGAGGLIAAVALSLVVGQQVSRNKQYEVTKLEIELLTAQRVAMERCSQARTAADKLMGQMWLADPLKWAQLQEEMLQRAEADRPELHAEFVRADKLKQVTCTQGDAEAKRLEGLIEERKEKWI